MTPLTIWIRTTTSFFVDDLLFRGRLVGCFLFASILTLLRQLEIHPPSSNLRHIKKKCLLTPPYQKDTSLCTNLKDSTHMTRSDVNIPG